VIGDDDEPSRAATPRPKEKSDASDAVPPNGKEKEVNGQGGITEEKVGAQLELPAEVRARLRKLDKLEPKYSGKATTHLFARLY
jgi:hypothetical protein